jgi:hypothetical protein
VRAHADAGAAYSAAFCAMLCVIALLLSVVMLVLVRPATAQGVKGEASVTVTGGYGRIVIRLATEVEAKVRLSGGILIVQFKEPVDVPVDRITTGATDYIGAARRDPDGRALRFALMQKVKVSSMAAGERLFIDLLPESWTGEPPGPPREVVEELARRARDAEHRARQIILAEQQSKTPAVRVRIASQPTFTRYIFDLPELTGVTVDHSKDKLTLNFPRRSDLISLRRNWRCQGGGRNRCWRQGSDLIGAFRLLAAG